MILLAALVFLFLQNRKHRKALKQSRMADGFDANYNAYGQTVLQSSDQGYHGELHGKEDFELSTADHERLELGVSTTRH